MIVRIAGEDQYRLGDEQGEELNRLDDQLVSIVESGREDGFGDALSKLLEFVREHGERVGDEELVASDYILPPSDADFAEVSREFTGEGLLPG